MEKDKIKKELEKLNRLIDMVNYDYKLYLDGKKESKPEVVEMQIRSIINKYRLENIKDPTLRIKYNNLISKYTAFKSRWGVDKGTVKTAKYPEYNGALIEQKLEKELLQLDQKYNKQEIRNMVIEKINEMRHSGANVMGFKLKIKNENIEVELY